VKLYLHLPNTPSWRRAELRKAEGQLYLHVFILLLNSTSKQETLSLHTRSIIFRRGAVYWSIDALTEWRAMKQRWHWVSAQVNLPWQKYTYTGFKYRLHISVATVAVLHDDGYSFEFSMALSAAKP